MNIPLFMIFTYVTCSTEIILFEKNNVLLTLAFSWTLLYYSKMVQTLQDYRLTCGLHYHSKPDDLDFFQGHRCVTNINCKLGGLDSCHL